MTFLALLALAAAALLPHPRTGHWQFGAAFVALTVTLLYLLGWRARDRAAGVTAALLTTASLPFLLHAVAAPRDALFVLLMVASLFSFVAGSSLAALALAGLAGAARPDGLLLGLILLGLALAQRRRRAALGAVVFVALAVLGWGIQVFLAHTGTPVISVAPRAWLVTWAVTAGMAFVTWLLLPFCAEMSEAPRRARWLPVLLWTVTYFGVESVVRVSGRASVLFGLTPLWFALAGGGLSRLLPALTGEFPKPWVRYGLATLALLSLVAIRLRAEWPHPHPPAPSSRPIIMPTVLPPHPAPALATAKPVPAKPVPAKPAHPAATKPVSATKPQAPAPHAAVTPKPVVKPAPKRVLIVHPFYRFRRPYYQWHRRR